MIITDIKKKTKTKSSIFIDNKYAFDLYLNEIKKLKLEKSKEITIEKYNKILVDYLYQKAKDKALIKLSKSLETSSRLYEYLKRNGFGEEISYKVVEELKDKKYLNDSEYARKYIKDRITINPIGKKELFFKLKNKGIDDHIIEDEITKAKVDDYKIAYFLAEKRFSKYDGITEDSVIKVMKYLNRKGFSYEKIKKTIEEIKGKYEKN